MRIQDHQMIDDGAEPPDHALTVDGMTEALAAMLSSCPLVEDLPHLPLLKTLGCNKLSKLRKTKMASFRLEEDQLVRTLLLCASTFRHLHINGRA